MVYCLLNSSYNLLLERQYKEFFHLLEPLLSLQLLYMQDDNGRHPE